MFVSAEINHISPPSLGLNLSQGSSERAVYFLTQGQLCVLDFDEGSPQSSGHTDSNILRVHSNAAQQFTF